MATWGGARLDEDQIFGQAAVVQVVQKSAGFGRQGLDIAVLTWYTVSGVVWFAFLHQP
jgi:hypothetical protein